jgi:hypothetical protein
MTLARLLAAALLLCSRSAVAQDSHSGTINLPTDRLWGTAAATTSEPWRIVPSQPLDGPGQDSRDGIRTDQYKADRSFHFFSLQSKTSVSNGQSQADTICYAIRSYRVARDSKDSDSTHPAGHSTCQPASRYHLRNAEERPVSVSR